MSDSPRSTYELSCGLFLRCLGLVYLVAFLSLWVQVDGLMGSRGILPVASFLDTAAEQLGTERFWRVPTLSWVSSSDGFLHVQCALGVVFAVLVTAGYVQTAALAGLWVLYLSLATAGRDFFSFQWDSLLLETGLLAIFLVTPRWRSGLALERPAPIAYWLLRWLLFRLMFASGVVKLSSGDETWHRLGALDVHYETQPIPNLIAWYVHQLPAFFHKLSVAVMFVVELVVPFSVWAPRRLRLIGCGALVALQLLISWTGNYGFFNLLTLALCLLLVDDGAWRRTAAAPAESRGVERAWRFAITPVLPFIVILTPVLLLGAFRVQLTWPQPLVVLYRTALPARSIASYGLFAVMTTERPEIVVEGSNDGVEWRAYRFRWKPGELDRPPPYIAPHMPRLDWQMWFAALGEARRNPWFIAFMGRLAEGSPPVLDLLEENPFPDGPPRFFRASFYDYRFTDFTERSATGNWWKREPRKDYLPQVGREQLLAALEQLR